jgi:hypothetical protein
MFHRRKCNVLVSTNPGLNNRLSKKALIATTLLVLTILIPVATAFQTGTASAYSQFGSYSPIANYRSNNEGRRNSGLMLIAEPAVVSIKAGDKAEYLVLVSNTKSNEGIVYLTLSGLPENTIGIFTPNMGIPNFTSRLTIVTENVKPGSYELWINAMNRKQSQTASVALTIKSAETTPTETTTSTQATTVQTSETTTTSTTTTESHNLKISFSTDKLSYEGSEPVIIQGVVTDSSQNAVNGASVSIQVENPQGSTAHIFQTSTDVQGFFNDTFTLPSDAADGTYTTSVSAMYQGRTGLASSTFVVGKSTTPAVSILNLNITLNGVPTTIFKEGQELLLSVQVINKGADLEKGMVWLEIDNPLDVPVYITLLSTGFSRDKVLTVEFHFFLQEDAIVGVYTANVYVSNGYISEGGVFFDKEQGQFIVEDKSSTTTTTTTTESTTTNETIETITTTTTNTTTTSETITETTTSTTNTTTQTEEGTTTNNDSNQLNVLIETSYGSSAYNGLGFIIAEKESPWRSELQ